MLVELPDGYEMFVEELGSGFPVILLHGGPGLDHTTFRPYLDPLAEDFRLLYVDARGQGRSARVDPEALSLDEFAHDVDLLADALELNQFALLGHSFGAIVATYHAIELATATAYVISGGGDSSAALERDVADGLAALGEGGRAIAESWELEKTVSSDEESRRLLAQQLPFHFHGQPRPEVFENVVHAPEVLRHFANIGYGDFDFTRRLGEIAKPTLVIVGEHDPTTSLRAARVLHDGIANSELVVVPGAGHMSYVEQQELYLEAVHRFLSGIAVKT